MFVNVPLITYSDFFVNTLLKDDTNAQEYFSKKAIKSKRVGDITGAYGGLMPEFELHPLFVKEAGQSYHDLKFKKRGLYSALKRKKRLSGSIFEDWVFRNKDESDEDLKKRQKEADENFQLKPYGSADSVEQIFERFAFLDKIKDRNFIISMTLIVKADQPEWGGFRQHKNGPYIGNKKMECEYFVDEGDQFKEIVLYNIIEVDFKSKNPVIETSHFNFLISEKTERHTYIVIFNKNNEVVAQAWRGDDGEIKVGHGNNVLFSVPERETMLLTIEAKLMGLIK